MENQANLPEISLSESNGIQNDQSIQGAYKMIIIQLEKNYPELVQNFDILVLINSYISLNLSRMKK